MKLAPSVEALERSPPPGYTGHKHGVQEVFGLTPAAAAATAARPPADSFLAARAAPPRAGSADAAGPSARSASSPAQPPNLWPALQPAGPQAPCLPGRTSLALGDERLSSYATTNSTQFAAPSAASARLRSPLRNKTLEGGSCDLAAIYCAAAARVGEARLQDVAFHMSERLRGKLGNSNDNAFKLRALFRRHDPSATGLVEIEDFRVMVESVGIQLDDDSLLALFAQYDPEATGRIQYAPLMRRLLDADTYRLWEGVPPA